MKQLILSIAVFFYLFNSSAQNMQEGFTYLETGKYKEATVFFTAILKKHPTNKTARLCKGRAIGLAGNSKEAITLFTNFLTDFPNDFEIKLNYAEALLWNKEYSIAKTYYIKLIQENDTSFPALLGYANTLSNLKNYKEALIYINKALLVSSGNKNAIISKKYIRLGFANKKSIAKDYHAAEVLLKENLIDLPNDTETLINLANLYLNSNQITKAENTYKTIGKETVNELLSLNGLSFINHKNQKNKKALEISKKAISKINSSTNISIEKQTKERYIQALLWNKKYKIAQKEIATLINERGSKNWILSLRATLNMYKSQFNKSISDYNILLKKDSSSFDGNLGKANALKASGKYTQAYKSAENTLTYYKNQKDAENFIKKLDKSFTPFTTTKATYARDNAKNQAYAYKTSLEFPITIKTKILGSYTYRKTTNNGTNISGASQDVLAGLQHQILPNLIFNGTIGFTSTNAATTNYKKLITTVFFNFKPFNLQNLTFGYKKEFHNFNADLLDREISQNHYYINYSINTNYKLGFFTQYFYTSQNDANTRNLFFSSLYYNILEKPSLKAGINYQNIAFKNQVPLIYFSPEKFNAMEVFFTIIKEEIITPKKEWFYELTGAIGFQYIENDEQQNTYRVQAKLGYKFSDRTFINLLATQSNIASATATGFTFTKIGLRFKWYLTKKPVFKKK